MTSHKLFHQLFIAILSWSHPANLLCLPSSSLALAVRSLPANAPNPKSPGSKSTHTSLLINEALSSSFCSICFPLISVLISLTRAYSTQICSRVLITFINAVCELAKFRPPKIVHAPNTHQLLNLSAKSESHTQQQSYAFNRSLTSHCDRHPKQAHSATTTHILNRVVLGLLSSSTSTTLSFFAMS